MVSSTLPQITLACCWASLYDSIHSLEYLLLVLSKQILICLGYWHQFCLLFGFWLGVNNPNLSLAWSFCSCSPLFSLILILSFIQIVKWLIMLSITASTSVKGAIFLSRKFVSITQKSSPLAIMSAISGQIRPKKASKLPLWRPFESTSAIPLDGTRDSK